MIGDLCRSRCHDDGVERRCALGAANQRRRQYDLYVFPEFVYREYDPQRFLRHRHRHQHGTGQCPKSGQHGHAAASRSKSNTKGSYCKKQTPTILFLIAVQSPDGRYDNVFISNYTQINVVNELLRLPGVSNATIINASNYSMRVWLRPDRLAQLQLTAEDVVNAIREQNKDFTAGMLGMPPMSPQITMTVPMTGQGRLNDPKEYENIILRAKQDGSFIRIKDVGYVELGAQSYDIDGKLDGKDAMLIAVYQEFGANALDVAHAVKNKMDDVAKYFPPGLKYTSLTIRLISSSNRSMKLSKLFLKPPSSLPLSSLSFCKIGGRPLFPVIAMAVSIIGTFAGMYVMGFSLNTLTLFGLVLAIGIVVDDAIVVIENVERNIRELKMDPREAAHQAMKEVSGPVVAIVFVLCAVFIPVAFLGGIAGQLYKQFAITISVSVVISGFVALTLSPALAAVLLSPMRDLPRFADWFNRNFDRFTDGYAIGVKWLLARTWAGGAIFAAVSPSLQF